LTFHQRCVAILESPPPTPRAAAAEVIDHEFVDSRIERMIDEAVEIDLEKELGKRLDISTVSIDLVKRFAFVTLDLANPRI